MEIFYKTISELESMLDSKEISAVELAKAVIERKNSVDGKVGAFLSANEDELLAEASISDSLRAEGKKRGALEGIPIGLKDVLAVRGQKLTCASKILENYVSPYTASSLEKLKSRGGIFWGRLNMDEFAMGSSCENSAFQTTHNPWGLVENPRRKLGRLGGRRCGGRVRGEPGKRYGRLNPPAGVALRRCGNEANLRAREQVRLGGVCVVSRPNRAFRALREGRGYFARSCRGARPERFHEA